MTVSPSVIASGSGRRFMISCGTKNGQTLYRAQYQFFFNGRPIGTGTPSNSSYIMVNASSSGNFTCNATQYSDLGTPIPSQLSPPVQAIVLGEWILGMICLLYNHQRKLHSVNTILGKSIRAGYNNQMLVAQGQHLH